MSQIKLWTINLIFISNLISEPWYTYVGKCTFYLNLPIQTRINMQIHIIWVNDYNYF